MKSLLLRLPKSLTPIKCNFCISLHFFDNRNIDSSEFLQSIRRYQQSIPQPIVIHLSVTLHSDLMFKVRNILEQSMINYLACSSCISEITNETVQNLPIGVIVTKLHQIQELKNNKNLIFYYLLNEAENKDQIETFISDNSLLKIYFFCPFSIRNSQNQSQNIYRLLKENFTGKFSTPFNIDLIDDRYPDHIGWVLEPFEIFSHQLEPSHAPSVSIIIPFYKRDSSILKVLAAILLI